MSQVVRAPKRFVLALTGGIASGKSNVANILREQGAEVVNADALGHEAYRVGTRVHEEIIKTFGESILSEDKSINRRALGGIVFGNPVQMKQLTDIVWPEIHREIKERVSQFRSSPCTQDASLMVVEAAVLLEAGWIDFADAVWVTEVPEEIAVQRLMERNQLSREDALSRIRSQLSNERRREIANFVINTNRSKTETKEIVLQRYMSDFKTSTSL